MLKVVEKFGCENSDTRWSCQLESIKAVLATFPSVLDTLQNIADGSGEMSRTIEASGLLAHIKCFRFIVSMIVYKKVFIITANLSDMLQAECLDYSTATSLILAAITTFSTMRSDDHWNLLWQESISLAKHVNCPVEPPNRACRARRSRPSSTYNDFVITASTVGNSQINNPTSHDHNESYKTDLYYQTLDYIFSKMNTRLAIFC